MGSHYSTPPLTALTLHRLKEHSGLSKHEIRTHYDSWARATRGSGRILADDLIAVCRTEFGGDDFYARRVLAMANIGAEIDFEGYLKIMTLLSPRHWAEGLARMISSNGLVVTDGDLVTFVNHTSLEKSSDKDQFFIQRRVGELRQELQLPPQGEMAMPVAEFAAHLRAYTAIESSAVARWLGTGPK